MKFAKGCYMRFSDSSRVESYLRYLAGEESLQEEENIDQIQSGNLMATFLRFSSISIQDTKRKHLSLHLFRIQIVYLSLFAA